MTKLVIVDTNSLLNMFAAGGEAALDLLAKLKDQKLVVLADIVKEVKDQITNPNVERGSPRAPMIG